jgi:hypothetical protein
MEIMIKNMARETVRRMTAKNAGAANGEYQKFRDMFFQKHGIKSEADAKKYAGTKKGAELDAAYKKEYNEYMQKQAAAKNAVPEYDLKDKGIYITWNEPGFGKQRGLVLHKYPDGSVEVRAAQGGYYKVKRNEILSQTATF